MSINSTHIISRDERRAFEAAWRTHVSSGKATAAAFILQAVLRGRDPKRGFTAVSSAAKLANGQRAWQGYEQALTQLRQYLGTYVNVVWPELMGKGLGPTRYESLLRDLRPLIDRLQKGA